MKKKIYVKPELKAHKVGPANICLGSIGGQGGDDAKIAPDFNPDSNLDFNTGFEGDLFQQ